MKLQKFANKIGVTPAAVSQWVGGSRKPGAWSVTTRAAGILKIDPGRLMDLLHQEPAAVRAMIKALPE